MKRAYIRVSSVGQTLGVQETEIKDRNCKRIYREVLSSNKKRPVLEKLLNDIKEGDILLVTKLDRLARSLKDFIRITDHLEKVGATLEIVNAGGLGMDEANGKLFIGMLAVIAEFETNLRRERQAEGIALARMNGQYKNRKRSEKAAKRMEERDDNIVRLRETQFSARKIAKLIKCSDKTVRRVLKSKGMCTAQIS